MLRTVLPHAQKQFDDHDYNDDGSGGDNIDGDKDNDDNSDHKIHQTVAAPVLPHTKHSLIMMLINVVVTNKMMGVVVFSSLARIWGECSTIFRLRLSFMWRLARAH